MYVYIYIYIYIHIYIIYMHIIFYSLWLVKVNILKSIHKNEFGFENYEYIKLFIYLYIIWW